MAENRWRICIVFFLSCASFPMYGCFFASYPDAFDASDFEEFQYRAELDPPCLESPSTSEDLPNVHYSAACEATITRETSGEYVVLLGVRTDFQTDSPYLPARTMTESEIERMLALFGELNINLHPQPYCTIPTLGGPPLGDIILRWDDLELVRSDCDRARLDHRQAFAISRFLGSLVTGRGGGASETTE